MLSAEVTETEYDGKFSQKTSLAYLASKKTNTQKNPLGNCKIYEPRALRIDILPEEYRVPYSND